MPSSPDPFVSRLLVRLAALGPVRSRAMFGSHGLYLDSDHIAIVDGRRVYFRVDPDSDIEPGARTFTYMRQGKRVALPGYRMPPPAVIDDGDAFLSWGERAASVARQQRRKRGTR
ncbi:MAG TPA: TfoX/Sxy family protein [Alphaproteobacteria bacterium]|jgi:DNA transformation protein|nr:TfoX/Sxy family protein [Alphaproteobacteria bacterium]